ncbi:Lrp/AsnC family transcriptional regulator [Ottowia sp.]|uniref:siroheme decarboxylase subunit beta n=1 Tax=Ottowia sp. TaxID=1898956 RepID=UPI002CCE98D5|nr:Lrp/AsnC family transcriptional regulator [Ottowia sp.]HRN75755.1 Lrp/AsnC family transcriptional regulator [Ottowia sp.]HRQ03329.1 Lrp/AsnC family transcriptional regulator [Ottowia sp.]
MPVRDAAQTLRERLLNEAQRDFPLTPRPFAALAERFGASESEVIQACRDGSQRGAISRIGGVWAPGVGGAALLCAMAVPPERLEAVAALVSAHPGVNHNYEREHRLNLWFVITGTGTEPLDQALTTIEQETALPVTRLKMVRPYRIDLGFDLHRPAVAGSAIQHRPPRVEPADHALAALVEAGLPLEPEPFAGWVRQLGCSTDAVLARIQAWLDTGTLRRFGLVVRHHEVGFSANAMTVFDIPDDEVDALGARLATQPGITLCYRRERAEGWPYNLYCMVHGRSREDTLALLQAAIDAAGLAAQPRATLFSRRRFKQTGARYFRPLPETADAR